jgi:acetyltransferase-like isoleucine patch superfamily enzyme
MSAGYYTTDELAEFHFVSCGENVQISRKASLYMTDKMSIGNNVRIDDFCILIGNITIGDCVHIAAYAGVHASHGSVTIGNFVGIGSQSAIYSVSDDFSGFHTINNVSMESYPFSDLSKGSAYELKRNLVVSDIEIGEYAFVGVNSVILPGAIIPEGASIGALSLVKKPLKYPWWVYGGNPAKRMMERIKTAF